MNAFRKTNSNTEISGCFFHCGQNIWWHLQRLGLQQQYVENANFALRSRMISTLAFVPVSRDGWLLHKFNWLTGPKSSATSRLFLGQIPGPNAEAEKCKKPTDVWPEIWNMYQRTLNEETRTNNSIKAWHRGVSAAFILNTVPQYFEIY